MTLECRKPIKSAIFSVSLLLPLPASAYTDLPGVRPPASINDDTSSNCKQVLVRNGFPFEPSNGPRYSYVYSCSQGALSIRSNQLPPSLERQKRGLNY